MNTLLTVVLFAQLVAASRAPTAQWVNAPVPHWSCPAGWIVRGNPPSCHAATRWDGPTGNYDPFTQESITWGWVEVIPENGTLRLDYAPGFVKIPGCAIEDKTDEKGIVRVTDVSKKGITLHAKPGHKLHLNCGGVVQRNEPPPRVTPKPSPDYSNPVITGNQ